MVPKRQNTFQEAVFKVALKRSERKKVKNLQVHLFGGGLECACIKTSRAFYLKHSFHFFCMISKIIMMIVMAMFCLQTEIHQIDPQRGQVFFVVVVFFPTVDTILN